MFSCRKGFSLVELLIVISFIGLLTSLVFVLFQPTEQRAKARDQKRLSDISSLERATSEYFMDKSSYPDVEDVTRTSTTLPSGNAGPIENVSGEGWIDVNFATYMSKLPSDPINDATYHYSYRHTTTSFELNATLEVLTDGQTDGGNAPAVYEVGNDLTII